MEAERSIEQANSTIAQPRAHTGTVRCGKKACANNDISGEVVCVQAIVNIETAAYSMFGLPWGDTCQGKGTKRFMRFWARSVVSAYLLAIIVASLAPHCDAMFQAAAHTQVSAEDCEHAGAGKDQTEKSTESECASMAMAKSMGPLPNAQLDVALLSASIAPVAVLPDALSAIVRTESVHPRGPPPLVQDGFASVFASNHRLLI